MWSMILLELLLNFQFSHKAPWVIFVKVNTGLLTLLDAATKVMQEEIIKKISNIEKYQPFSLLHDQFVLSYVLRDQPFKKSAFFRQKFAKFADG